MADKWLSMVADYAHETGAFPKQRKGSSRYGYAFQLHHVVGRKYVHNKIPLHQFVLPIWIEYHDVNIKNLDPVTKTCLNVTHFRKRYTNEFGLQCHSFKFMIDYMLENGGVLPFDDNVINAIMDTRR